MPAKITQIDAAIRMVAEAFAAELSGIRSRAGKSKMGYAPTVLTLEVSVGENDSCGMAVKYSQGYGNTVTAATYNACLKEVYRRLGFDDDEAQRLEEASRALRALPAE